jgi:glyoxylase-like metal-dependent hydrolase (beta-lactamase superfamily II)
MSRAAMSVGPRNSMTKKEDSAGSSPVYPHPQPPAPGERLQVADGAYWLAMPLPFALDHINLWLLRDTHGWVIVDTGISTDDTKRLWEHILAECLKEGPVTRIIATHYHPDHLGLAAWLMERLGADLFMSQGDYLTAHAVGEQVAGYGDAQVAELFRQHGLSGPPLDKIATRGNTYRRGVPVLPNRYRRLQDNDILAINGRPWEVLMGYGHAPEHAALYCDDLRVLIAGDMMLPRISTNVAVGPVEPEGDPLKLFLDSIESFRPLPEDTLVLPSHGKVFRGLHGRIDDLRRHHEARLTEILEACATPRSAAELLPLLFRRELDTHQLFFAMGEAIAHLNHLMYRNLLARSQREDGVYRFVAIGRT